MCTDGYGEDFGLDGWLEAMYDERYEEPDYEVFERNQLALDNDFDYPYDEDDEDDLGFYDSLEYDDPA